MIPSLALLDTRAVPIGTPLTAYEDIREFISQFERMISLMQAIVSVAGLDKHPATQAELDEVVQWLDDWREHNEREWDEHFSVEPPRAVPPRPLHPPEEDAEGDVEREEQWGWKEPLVLEGWAKWFERKVVGPFNTAIDAFLPDWAQAIAIVPVAMTTLGLKAYDDGMYSKGAGTLAELLRAGARRLFNKLLFSVPVRSYLTQTRFVAKIIVSSMLISSQPYGDESEPENQRNGIAQLANDPLLMQTLYVDYLLDTSEDLWVYMDKWRIVKRHHLLDAHAALLKMYDIHNMRW